MEKRAIDVLKLEAGKQPWGAQDQIPYDKIQAKIIELLSTMEFGNGATQSTSIAVPDTSGVDTPTAADTVSAVPDTLGADTLTAGGTPAAPPPTTQQGSETFRYTDSVLAQKIIDALYSLKLQIEDNAGQSTPQQEAAVEFLKTKLDSLRIP